MAIDPLQKFITLEVVDLELIIIQALELLGSQSYEKELACLPPALNWWCPCPVAMGWMVEPFPCHLVLRNDRRPAMTQLCEWT